MSDLISVIVPCYNEEVSLPFFYKEIQKVISHMQERYPVEFELLFVDDGSRDDTLSIIKSFASKDPKIKYLSFSRNFGKESAILAGLEHATGDYVALMDADLQDPPSLLTQMYETIKEGTYDCVGTKRVDRKGEPPIRSFFARCFYKLINKISKTSIVDGARDFRLMTRQMTDAILNMPEYNRFSKGIFGWVGFKTKWLEYTNVERVAGSTKWSFWSLFLYSLDGIVAFSTIPLSIASILGILFLFIALIFIIVIIVKTLIWGDPVAGYPSMMCVICLLGGLQLFSIGILGQYLSKTYLEVKHRPIYIIKESNTAESYK
ncbi:glycosyltransferase family 2 protein [Dorea acetigenes]|uniref:Glycosyltransferase family 2 protein n=1 Tax=Dorea acetigenes TaxID=2981787 RepID=A0ABT2RIM9_9FIRM|nr:glycosyltransferase family 2 protein [Dorea acetigenes]MCB6414485.1 glycosyltransferase family 2 protein [Faecalimonas umbilicata]MCU6685270.1 glycosyltransferase family 2 protein [Dorea acetigenes]SCI42316.1 Bactoprenol glucosyl transferase homolog from prophage CPS-53 [uncultured Clostridium sp.]